MTGTMKSLLILIVFLIPLSSSGASKYLLQDVCESKIRSQIDTEMHASLVYMNMAAYFGKNSVGRPGFERFFKHQSEEEREHAWKFTDYLNKRGSELKTLGIQMPLIYRWSSPLNALNDAINLENEVYDKIYKLHQFAEKTCQDPHLMDFLEGFMTEQIESIDQLTRFVTQLKVMKDGTGEFLLDSKLLEMKY